MIVGIKIIYWLFNWLKWFLQNPVVSFGYSSKYVIVSFRDRKEIFFKKSFIEQCGTRYI